jgi:uroporphyrin-III C-methyltransferase/precorrin-2 dehydrogenase/sirohydrochlorin ferrochelatase
VRLKSGDPLVFSHIAQEIDDLKAHGIGFEIVPGISAGHAGASYHGIPLTHRDLASDIVFVSGHDLHHSVDEQQSDWQAIARQRGTIS